MKEYTDINTFIAEFPEEVQIILEKIRATIQQAAPEAKEAIKYGMPTFVLNGNLVHFAAYKNHIGLYPAPTGIDAFIDELAIYRTGKGTIQFPIEKPIPFDLISKVVKYRVQENLNKKKKKEMKIEANTPEQYIAQVPEERKQAMIRLRQTIHDNLPKGFKEEMSYGMIGYVVPKSIYPQGYHCAPELPLPFINIASQKNFVALYHMGIYAEKEILDWFTQEFPKHSKLKLDMGKSCIRFKKPELIPFELIAELVQKISVEKWIGIYESNIKPKK